MDKLSRSRRLQSFLPYIPDSLDPRAGMFFGEHVVRVGGQLCLVVTLDGEVGIRATRPELVAELRALCGDRHWIAHGRVYEQWYLLPGHQSLYEPPVTLWVARAAEGARQLACAD